MRSKKRNYEMEIYRLFNNLGVNHSYKGVAYLFYLINYILKKDLDYSDTTVTGKDGWYSLVAEHFNAKNEQCVERCIRHVIKKLKTDNETYRDIFANNTNLTNKQFIMSICQYLRYNVEE